MHHLKLHYTTLLYNILYYISLYYNGGPQVPVHRMLCRPESKSASRPSFESAALMLDAQAPKHQYDLGI